MRDPLEETRSFPWPAERHHVTHGRHFPKHRSWNPTTGVGSFTVFRGWDGRVNGFAATPGARLGFLNRSDGTRHRMFSKLCEKLGGRSAPPGKQSATAIMQVGCARIPHSPTLLGGEKTLVNLSERH